MDSDQILDILKTTEIFAGLEETAFTPFNSGGEVIEFSTGNPVITEGQTEKFLYIVLDGLVEVYLPHQTPNPELERENTIELTELTKGDCFGEYGLIDDQPASASVIAIEQTKLFKISKDSFESILGSSDTIAKTIYKNLLTILVNRLRDNNATKGVLIFQL